MSKPADARAESLAAGALPVRHADGGRVEVLLIHRPRYDDWTFAKGHVDPGEHVAAAAVREVREETGLTVRLGPPLPPLAYGLSSGLTKLVRYWVADATDAGDSPEPEDTKEVDEVAWVDIDHAAERLTYDDEIALLDAVREGAAAMPYTSLILLRHAHAKSRSNWDGDDLDRPLSKRGLREAAAVPDVVGAFGPTRILTSPAVRCRQTAEPLAEVLRIDVEIEPAFAEESSGPLTEAAMLAVRNRAVAEGRPAVLVGHRPLLPAMFSALDVPPVTLTPGAFVVVQFDRAGTPVSQEVYTP